MVALDREPAVPAPSRRRRPKPSRPWPLRLTWLFIIAASLALWALILVALQALI